MARPERRRQRHCRLRAAIRLDPKDSAAYESRAFAWLEKNETDKALADFNSAIAICPEKAVLYAGRGRVWATTAQRR